MCSVLRVDRILCATCPGTCLFCTYCPATGSKNGERDGGGRGRETVGGGEGEGEGREGDREGGGGRDEGAVNCSTMQWHTHIKQRCCSYIPAVVLDLHHAASSACAAESKCKSTDTLVHTGAYVQCSALHTCLSLVLT